MLKEKLKKSAKSIFFFLRRKDKKVLISALIILIALFFSLLIIFSPFDKFFIKKSLEKGFNSLIVGDCLKAEYYGFNKENCETKKIFESILEIKVLRIEKKNDNATVQIMINSVEDGKKEQRIIVLDMKKKNFFIWELLKNNQ